MKTIIVPLDFSHESLSGLNMAVILATKSGAKIEMVHVIRKDNNAGDELIKEKFQHTEKKFTELLNKYKDKISPKLIMQYSVKEGKIFDSGRGF